MPLESAVYASQTGLQAHGTAMSVIGDNVSNANTIAFKAGGVKFSDILGDGLEEGNSSSATPVTGDGVVAADVLIDHSVGATEVTGRSLDVVIDGEGYFSVGDATNPIYTRAGNFLIDENGLLASSTGQNILGFTGTGTTLGTIDMLNLDVSGTPSSEINVSGNLNSGEAITTVPAGPATFAEIGAAANFVSNVTSYDSLGGDHNILVGFFKTAANSWTAQAYIDGAEVGQEAGIPVQVGADTVLTFETTGQISAANAAAAVITATPAYSGGPAAGNFTIDLSRYTQFAGNSLTSAITQDGQGTGDISDYRLGADGSINAVLTNGTEVLVGSLPIANFNNKEGLVRVGNASYQETQASGTASFDAAGVGGRGSVSTGVLELSNVDLAKEFSDMVIFQRGYSASSQVLSQAIDMIRETISLIR